ncbi:MAG: hypothetical protein IJ421_09920 [Prevotella sp.]|nr:hypothetical protein [Prevotella sp.]
MAKKINTEEAPKTEEQTVAPVETAEIQTESAEMQPEEEVTETPVQVTSAETEKEAMSETAIPPHVLELLKKYPRYESLYIDSHGGTFTPNTPAAIRGKAELYKNPYFDELKKR